MERETHCRKILAISLFTLWSNNYRLPTAAPYEFTDYQEALIEWGKK